MDKDRFVRISPPWRELALGQKAGLVLAVIIGIAVAFAVVMLLNALF